MTANAGVPQNNTVCFTMAGAVVSLAPALAELAAARNIAVADNREAALSVVLSAHCHETPGITCIRSPDLTWCVDASNKTLSLVTTVEHVADCWLTAVRAMFHALAMLEGHVTLHASSVAGPAGALLFAGKSGAGKSTTAKMLSRYAPPLDDDLAFLVERDGRVMVRNTAGCLGTSAAPELVPLAGIFFIEQAAECRVLEKLPAAEAASRLTTEMFTHESAAATGQLLERIAHTVKNIPVSRLAVSLERKALADCLNIPRGL